MIEEDYIILLSSQVRNFKKTATNKYRFSCPACGDSKRFRSLARGNLFIYKGEWYYNCYNCPAAHKFPTFLKLYFPDLYDDYIYDQFGYSKKKKVEPLKLETKKPVFKTSVLSGDDIFSLDYDSDDGAVTYLKSRLMTKEMIEELYYAPNFKKYVNNTLIPDKFEHIDDPDPRIVIPFFSLDNKVIGLQGRSLDKDNPVRYITIKLLPDDEPLLYGLDKIDQSRDVFVLEGPIDAMFIDNAVAWAGGSLHKVNGVLFPILVWDNEPYNKDINKQIQKAINMGFKIVVWPKRNKWKDVNKMIIEGMNIDAAYLFANTYQGLEAQLEFDQWRKT